MSSSNSNVDWIPMNKAEYAQLTTKNSPLIYIPNRQSNDSIKYAALESLESVIEE